MRHAVLLTALLGTSVAGFGQSLTINTSSLPTGNIGQNYLAPLSVTETGGPPSPKLVFSITLGALPPSVNINPDNGTISGTPSAPGLFSFRVTVQDTIPGANVTPGNANLSILINGFSLSILNPSLPNGSVNTFYSAQLFASDSASPNAQFQWSISSGSLPTGLSLNQSNGFISGIATTSQNVSFSVTASEGLFQSVSKQFSINIAAAPPVAPPVIIQTSLPAAGQGLPYTFALTATGGVPPYSWNFGGVNNSGLVINSATGVITGTPPANGTFLLTALLTDSIDETASRVYSLNVSNTLQILTAFLPTGSIGSVYSQTLAAIGGNSPYIWSVISGALPSGLTLSSFGAITGTPAAAGTASFTVRVIDNESLSATQTYNLAVSSSSPALTITTGSTLPPGSVGTFYAQSLMANGGVMPYTWSLVSGAIPSGLSLSSLGTITGTPTAAGTVSFTARVTDATSSSATQTFSLTVGISQVFTSALRVPQIVDGAGWTTRFSIINTDQVPVTFTFRFWDDNGNALLLPILNGTPGVLSATLAPGASYFTQSPGVSSTLQQGWAEVASSGQIGVTAIFQFSGGSPQDSLGSVIATPSGQSILMPFDYTQGSVTAFAIANTNPTQPLTVSMLFETDGGAQSTSSIILQPRAHQAVAASVINPAVAGYRGSIKFTAQSADMAIVGLEFTSDGRFTSLGTFQ